MIRITYATADEALARKLRHDLSGSEPSHEILIVLVSAASNAEPALQAEIARTLDRGGRILPILAERADLPPALQDLQPLDFSAGYQLEPLLNRLQISPQSMRQRRRSNRLALVGLLAIVLLVFGIAVVAMNRGLVAFPVAEYNEEATFQAQWIDGLIRETLEYVQPRGTADAIGFAATYEAAPTRLHFYIRGTATALPGA